ncbi:hypothetical protein CCH79_00012370 [Gambusia affinis]|uniref:Uncharacterized protein n=1 Tax=Gambusia affinis TaxID=33528 RepID=A0A315W976_GAMAF|nr:hypothetical protein CCH79_00012370 [Gambusia affinis]
MEHWALVAREHMSLQPMWDSKQREETATPVTAHAWGQTYTDHRHVLVGSVLLTGRRGPRVRQSKYIDSFLFSNVLLVLLVPLLPLTVLWRHRAPWGQGKGCEFQDLTLEDVSDKLINGVGGESSQRRASGRRRTGFPFCFLDSSSRMMRRMNVEQAAKLFYELEDEGNSQPESEADSEDSDDDVAVQSSVLETE